MNTILIDYTSVIKKYYKFLDFFIEKMNNALNLEQLHIKRKSNEYSIGICLIIPKEQLEYLDSLENGLRKINYINDISFINSITNIFYILYSKKKNICELHNINYEVILPNMKLFLYSLLDSFPSKTMLWARVSEINISTFTELGFRSSFLCNKNPLNNIEYEDYGLCMYKKNDGNFNRQDGISKEIEKTFESYNSSKCTLRFKFTTESLQFLRSLCKTGKYLKNGKFVHKEIAGSLILSLNDNNYYDINVQKDSLIVGKNEEVAIADSRYNFHSHPEQAYIRHKVSDGHPSGPDYLGYFQAIKVYGTVFHCVVSLEGVYIMSLREYWCNKDLSKLSEKSIGRKYNIPHDTLSHRKYMKKINSISFNNQPLFTLSFIEWDTEDCDKIFTVFSSKTDVNCLISDESYKLYKNFY